MNPIQIVSEDDRRALGEFGAGRTWKIGKYVLVKSESVVGNHYHKKKDELFLILRGKVVVELGEEAEGVWVTDNDLPRVIEVPRGVRHAFHCSPGTIIIGLASELHDPSDDHT